MAVFTVHLPPEAAGAPVAPEKIAFLRDGFSWYAFIFGPFWLAWNRAWLASILWTAALVTLAIAGWKLKLPKDALSWASLAMGVVLGFEGVRLVAWTLARRGYTEAAVVIGDDSDEAEEVFFHDWRPTEAPAAIEAAPDIEAAKGGAAGERRD